MKWGFLAVVLGVMLPVWADLLPPPPAIHVQRPASDAPHSLQDKGAGVVNSIGEPSDDEQLMLEQINRARLNPVGEAFRLATMTISDIEQAYSFFSVDLNAMYDAISAIPAVPPLAINARLGTAARLHSGWMLTNISQSHFETNGLIVIGPDLRIATQGYLAQNYGENIYSTASDPVQAHVAFEVDWGFGPGGMQDPPDHRLNNHSPDFREAGVGFTYGNRSYITTNGFRTNIVAGITNILPILVTTSSGPDSVTVDFGTVFSSTPFITGVAYYDIDGDQFYGLGEGLGGLSVTATGLSTSAVTATSGGYTLPAANGNYQVVFSMPGYASTPIPVTVAKGDNEKVDLIVPYVAPTVSGPAQALIGAMNLYNASRVPISTGYQWQVAQGTAYTTVEGAESGTGNITTNVSGYSVISTDFAASGTSCFHLVHLTQDPQVITLRPVLKLLPGASVSFATQFGFATTNEFGSFEISTNGGTSWISVWKQAGITTSNQVEHAFTTHLLNLSAYAGANIQARFAFTTVGNFFNKLAKPYGVYLDNISFGNAELLGNPVIGNAASDGSFSFSPAANGKFYLSARPIVGSRMYPFGSELTVIATNTVAPSAVTRAINIGLGGTAPNRLQIEYKVLSGIANAFQLEQALDVTGPWQPVVGATLGTNGSGNRVFGVNPSAARAFFRLAAQ